MSFLVRPVQHPVHQCVVKAWIDFRRLIFRRDPVQRQANDPQFQRQVSVWRPISRIVPVSQLRMNACGVPLSDSQSGTCSSRSRWSIDRNGTPATVARRTNSTRESKRHHRITRGDADRQMADVVRSSTAAPGLLPHIRRRRRTQSTQDRSTVGRRYRVVRLAAPQS